MVVVEHFRCRICGHNRYDLVRVITDATGTRVTVRQCTRCKCEEKK